MEGGREERERGRVDREREREGIGSKLVHYTQICESHPFLQLGKQSLRTQNVLHSYLCTGKRTSVYKYSLDLYSSQ